MESILNICIITDQYLSYSDSGKICKTSFERKLLAYDLIYYSKSAAVFAGDSTITALQVDMIDFFCCVC